MMCELDTVIVTLDLDWAPDFVIDYVADKLAACNVKASWFITHQSPAVDSLRQDPGLFELGIHPNFLPGSSHGESQEEVINHLMTLVPDAVSMRTHSLVQSTPLLNLVMERTSIKFDVSLFLPHANNLQPIEYFFNGNKLLRVPYFWEDDFEMEYPKPIWQLAPILDKGRGLKVFDFHPIHLYLNSASMHPYREIKSKITDIKKATARDLADWRNKEEGAFTIFKQLLDQLKMNQNSQRICDIGTSVKGVL